MRTILLTSIFALFLSSINISASTQKLKYSNIQTTENGTIKEYVTYDNLQSKAVDKTVYIFDKDENLLDRTVYKWDDNAGWVKMQKHNYSYDNEGKITYFTFSKWDNKQNIESKEFTHLYDNEGNLLSIIESKKSNSNLMTQR